MKITRIKLTNYMQHADVDQQIDGTLIAVVGPNGSGKSNLLSAPQFALTGVVPGKTKADLLGWQAEKGSVLIEFEHNNIKGSIKRNIHNASCHVQYGEYEATTARDAEALISLYLSVDKNLAQQAVFVAQAKIDNILTDDPAIREVTFQRLLGIGDANKVHSSLGKIIGKLEQPQDYDQAISEATVTLADLRTRMTELEMASATSDELLNKLKFDNIADIDGEVTRLSRLKFVYTQKAEALLAAETAKVQQAALMAEIVELEKLSDGDYEAASLESDRLQEKLDAMARYAEAKQVREAAGHAVIALGEAPSTAEEIAELKSQYDIAVAKVGELNGTYTLYNDLLTALQSAEGLEACPVCGAAVTDIAGLKQRLHAQATALHARLVMATQSRDNASKAQTHATSVLTKYETDRIAAIAHYNTTNNAFKLTPEITGDIEVARTEYREAAAKARNILEYSSALQTKRGALTQVNQVVKETEARAATYKDTDTGIPTTGKRTVLEQIDYECSVLTSMRAELVEIDKHLSMCKGAIAEVNSAIVSAEVVVSDLGAKRDSQAGVKEAIETLTAVRNWFHYKNGPHTLSSNVLTHMTDEVNKFLGHFAAPFVVEPCGDTLGFYCQFTDGRKVPDKKPEASKVLSGGEKVQLAVAFRFASYCMFAAKLGLLSLDEPTVYLDDSKVAAFCDLLTQIKRVAKSMNLQVLLATHERSVIPFCDSIIDVSDLTDVEKTVSAGIDDIVNKETIQ